MQGGFGKVPFGSRKRIEYVWAGMLRMFHMVWGKWFGAAVITAASSRSVRLFPSRVTFQAQLGLALTAGNY